MGDQRLQCLRGERRPQAPAQFIAKHFLDKLRDNPSTNRATLYSSPLPFPIPDAFLAQELLLNHPQPSPSGNTPDKFRMYPTNTFIPIQQGGGGGDEDAEVRE